MAMARKKHEEEEKIEDQVEEEQQNQPDEPPMSEVDEEEEAGLTEAQKAALLVMGLEEDKAAAVLQNMSESTIAKMKAAVDDLQRKGVRDEHKLDALKSFFVKKRLGGILIGAPGERFQRVLREALGEERVKELYPVEEEEEKTVERSRVQENIEYLKSMDDETLAKALSRESPRTGAVLIVMLEGQRVGRILNLIDDEEAREKLLDRIISARNIPSNISEEILEGFCENLREISEADVAAASGDHYQPQELSQMLLTLEKGSRERILGQLKEQNPDFAAELERRMLQFEDIPSMDDQGLWNLLAEFDDDIIGLALKGASDEVSEKILKNMSERKRARVQEERELSGRKYKSEVQEARDEIMRQARQLWRDGELIVYTGGEQFVE